MQHRQLIARPITQKAAFAWIAQTHSHLKPPRGWLFGVSIEHEGRLCCVSVLGRPSARNLQNGRTAGVTRVAADHTPHASSKALAAVTRAAIALGYTRLVSYIREDEEGTTYKAAGWWPTAVTEGGEWARQMRLRGPAEQPCPKVRWEYGPEAAPRIELPAARAAA